MAILLFCMSCLLGLALGGLLTRTLRARRNGGRHPRD